MATQLPYYTGTDDIYSQLMAQYAQQIPYYGATPYNAGGYDTSLYYRPPVQLGGGFNYSGLLGGAGGFSGGPDAVSSVNTFADPNSITNGLIAAIFGQDPSMVAVDSLGGNLANLANVNLGLDIGLLGQAPETATAADQAAIDASQAMGQGMVSMNSLEAAVAAQDAADAAATADAAANAGMSIGQEGQAPSGEGGGGGGGGGKIICTKLHSLGKMPTEIYQADQAFGAQLVKSSPQTYYGYASWAQHVVRWMGRDDLFGKFVVACAYAIATPWSIAMAEEMGVNVKSNWFGRFLLKRGLQVCQIIGEMGQDRSAKNV